MEAASRERRVVVDTDTAGDDAVALLMAACSRRLTLDAVTVVAGNVEFDREVENAKYTLRLAGAADEVPVYEGARSPLLKSHEYADYVHGEGGLGGDLLPDTGVPSADGFAPEYIARAARESPGEVSLLCIGPLTNVALALAREPDLDELLDEVWVMGGAANCPGNVTPAAEYNFWVDPDAAKVILRDLDVTLVDWGVCVRGALLDADDLAPFGASDSPYAEFFTEITGPVRSFTEAQFGVDGTTQPDSLTAAVAIEPGLVTDATTCFVDVDEREGLTRGYSLVDEHGATDGEPRTRVVEAVDGALFYEMLSATLLDGDPERPLADGGPADRTA